MGPGQREMPSIGRRERAVVRSTHWDSRRFVEPVLSGSSRCMSCSPELASLLHLELQKSMRNYFYSIKKMVFSIMESKRFKLLKGNEEELTWLTSCGPRWGGTMHRVKAGAWGSVSSPCPLPTTTPQGTCGCEVSSPCSKGPVLVLLSGSLESI